jgi:hypothetical protein
MSRSRTVAIGLTTGAVLAISLVGCAKGVSGTPQAGSTPPPTTTHSTPATQPSSSGGNTQGAQFCAQITPAMVQQAFGTPGATITPGQQQTASGVQSVSCIIAAASSAGQFGVDVIAFDFSGQASVTVQSALQNAQDQLGKAGNSSNFQQQSGIGDSDGAFSYSVTAQDGKTGFAVYAAKAVQGDVEATDIAAIGDVQLSQVIAFAKILDTD